MNASISEMFHMIVKVLKNVFKLRR